MPRLKYIKIGFILWVIAIIFVMGISIISLLSDINNKLEFLISSNVIVI
jgi:hypothetical protein